MRPSPEVLLISSLVNTGQVEQGEAAGVSPEMLDGYQSEYRWLLAYRSRYGQEPSVPAFLSSFPDFPLVGDACDIHFAADELRHADARRRLKTAVRDAARHISEGDLEQAMLAVASFTPPGVAHPISNSLVDTAFLDDYDTPVKTLPVPWHSLRAQVGGLRAGDLWIVAARTGQGKSWTLGCMIRDLMLAGYRVGLYSLEMPERQVQIRMHVLLGRALGLSVDHVAMRDRVYDRTAYHHLMAQIKERVPGSLYIHDTARGRVSPSTLAAQASNFDVAFVDYAGLMVSPLGNRAVEDWRQMASISNMLKEAAVGKDIPVVAAAQINREGETNSWRPPRTKNLSQSDALGQDADVVITHRQYSRSTMVYLLDKNRHGESEHFFWTQFKPNTGMFNEITRDEADDIRDRETPA